MRPRSWDGAADHLPAEGFPPGRGTGFGGLRVSARTLEVKKKRSGKKPGASFYFKRVRPHGMAFLCMVKPCNFSLYPTIIYIIFFRVFFPRSASDKEMSLV